MSRSNGTQIGEGETCLSRLSLSSQEEFNGTDSFLSDACNVIWDGFNCWGPAQPGSTIYLPCPAAKGMDVTKHAYRTCSLSGQWLNKKGIGDERGWTNYTPCFTPEIIDILLRLGSEEEAILKIDIARRTRILEYVGLSLSLTALLLSLFVFYYFRSLRNPRTRLHRHLFIAMVIQVAVRLTLYIDQFIVRSNLDEKTSPEQQQDARGIDNTPILCEAAYICLEYARTAMFMWMFVEGLYLHNMITVTVFEEKLSPAVYRIVGWVFPIPLTLAWAVVTAKHYGTATCWWGYNFTLYFWILEGPRLGVLMVNLAFLLNILRVLVTKLRQSNSSEAHQARKAVKAALVLLPLLGLTNLLNMLDAPLERSALIFGLWSYTTHTLTSCQGLIVAWLYCFWNGEVQLALKKFVRYKILNNRKNNRIGGKNARGSVRLSLMNNSTAGGNGGTLLGQSHRVQCIPDLKNFNGNNTLTVTNTNTNSISNSSPAHGQNSTTFIKGPPHMDLNHAVPLTIPLTMKISPCKKGTGSRCRVLQLDSIVDFDSRSSTTSQARDSLTDNDNSLNLSKSDSDLFNNSNNQSNYDSNYNSTTIMNIVTPKKKKSHLKTIQRGGRTFRTTGTKISTTSEVRESSESDTNNVSNTNHSNNSNNSNSTATVNSGGGGGGGGGNNGNNHKLRRLSKLKIWISPFVLVGEQTDGRENGSGKKFFSKKVNSDSSPSITGGNNCKTQQYKRGEDTQPLSLGLVGVGITEDETSSELTSTEGCDFKIEMLQNIQVI